MGEDCRGYARRRDRQPCPIAQAQGFVALEKTAIDQDAMIVLFQQVFGAGDRSGPTQEGEFQHVKTGGNTTTGREPSTAPLFPLLVQT